jgi:hypothetical protein
MDPLLLSCWDEVKHLIGIELIRSICIVCKQNIEEAPSKKACIGGCQAMLCGNAECAQFFGQTHNRVCSSFTLTSLTDRNKTHRSECVRRAQVSPLRPTERRIQQTTPKLHRLPRLQR